MTKEELKQLENDLWSAADKLRANSDLKSNEYAKPVLGLIFLKFADNNYRRHEADIIAEYQKLKGTRREKKLSEIAIEKCGFYLPDHARYDYLLNLPEEEDIAKALKEAMKAIEEYKPELDGVLPKDEYFRLTRDEKTRTIPNDLLKNFSNIPVNTDGDLFGQIYEYFLAEFARSEGQKGGEFFTPRSVVRLMVEMIEPQGGKVFDPACGSGGMFVQSVHFIEEHRKELSKDTDSGVFVYGQEKTLETVNLAKMNLAVNGLRGEIKKANTYYEDAFGSFGAFDYVLANPPFNVDDVSLSSVEKDKRFNTYGIPRKKSKAKKSEQGKETVPNANYLWINLFATSLKTKGRAALVMANSASDARHSEAEIRQRLIKENLIYAMLTLPSNMFYTVTLPATLWFFDKAKTDDRILFIDGRNIYTQIDRVHREFSDEQIQNITIINHLHKGRREKFVQLIDRYFAAGMERLNENKTHVEPVSAQLLEVLDDEAGKQAVTELVKQWSGLNKLQTRYEQYREKHAGEKAVDQKNKAQQQLRKAFDPFFAALHEGLKQLDKTVRQHEKQQAEQAQTNGKRLAPDRKTKALKIALEALHTEVKNAETQKKIAAILSAYDDLIENNKCRIVLLEKMTEEIYREWFVRLRFPGHEKVKVVKNVPEAWSFEKACSFFGLAKGKSYAGEEITDDPEHMPFISLKSFNRGGGYREDGLKYYSGRYKEEQVARQSDVVMALTDMTQDRAVVGRVARIPDFGAKGAVISLDAVKLIPKAVNKTFLYCYMRYSGFGDFIKEFANGANVLHLKAELITQQKIIVPPTHLQEDFAAKADPIYKVVDLLTAANKHWRHLRDILLPRLISGKLSVENLDIQFPPGMVDDLNTEPTATVHA